MMVNDGPNMAGVSTLRTAAQVRAEVLSDVLDEHFDKRWRVRDAVTECAVMWQMGTGCLAFTLAAKAAGNVANPLLFSASDFASLFAKISVFFFAFALPATVLSALANRLGKPFALDPQLFPDNRRVIDELVAKKLVTGR
jgi:hypothetical protein